MVSEPMALDPGMQILVLKCRYSDQVKFYGGIYGAVILKTLESYCGIYERVSKGPGEESRACKDAGTLSRTNGPPWEDEDLNERATMEAEEQNAEVAATER
eukprot:Gb_31680 [translate_table: standard]